MPEHGDCAWIAGHRDSQRLAEVGLADDALVDALPHDGCLRDDDLQAAGVTAGASFGVTGQLQVRDRRPPTADR
jgi:hypothetical protein